MPPINLIPAARIEQRRYRAVRQRCIVGCIAYGIVALTVGIVCHVIWGTPDPRTSQLLDEAAGVIDRTDKAIVGIKTDLDATQQTLQASRAISEQPDWSIVMALLASRAGDEIVLKSCAVRQIDPPQVAVAPPKPGKARAKPPVAAAPLEPSMLLSITGAGLSQKTVSQFVLRLEKTHLFARVQLVNTTRTTIERRDAVAFSIECSLDDPGTGKPQNPPQVAGTSKKRGKNADSSSRGAEPAQPEPSPDDSANVPTDEVTPGTPSDNGGPRP